MSLTSAICLLISVAALVVALCSLRDERARHQRDVQRWEAQRGTIPEGLGGTPWTRRQAA